jgi:hypothetical protein
MRFFPKHNKEAGVAILLTVMIISGITVITTTVAFFVVQEIRANRGSGLTEPAIVAAETASEQGLYQFKRGNFNTQCDSNPAYTDLAGVAAGTSNVRVRSCLTGVPAVFQFSNTKPLVVYLYDPDNVNGNTCMERHATNACPADGNGTGLGWSQVFSSVFITYVTGSFNINISAQTLDGAQAFSAVLAPGSAETEYPIAVNYPVANDERLKITLTPTSGSSTVSIRTIGAFTGLPDYQTLDAEGCASFGTGISDCDDNSEVYKRRINVTLPN